MLPELDSRFSVLQLRKRRLLERLTALDEDGLRFKPSSDAWCLLEVVDHVVRSEAASLGYVSKKLPHVEPSSRPGVRSRWAFPLLRLVLSLPLRLRMPASIRESLGPGENLDLGELEKRWETMHSQWQALLEEIPAEMLEAPLFRHPISGHMNLDGALHFLAVHFDHHLRQIDRLLGHEDFPTADGA